MKAIFLIILAVVIVGAGLRAAGTRLPFLDYPVGPFDGRGPAMPDVQIEPPGFGDFPAP